MSYTDKKTGWRELDEDELPDLTTEEGRDEWIQILVGQDDDTLRQNESGWSKALTVADENGNMMLRIIYPEGGEEVFDLLIRRQIEISAAPSEERN